MTTGAGAVTVDGVDIEFTTAGRGSAVLLVHGFTGDRSTMSDLATRLSQEHCVVSLDLVGHGGSASPDDLEHYSMAAATRHLDAVLQAVDIERAHVIGYSLGGRVALSFACAAAHRVASLTLIGASPGLQGEERAARRAADDRLADDIENQGLEVFVDHWMALPMWRSLESSVGEAAWAGSRNQRLAASARGLANSLRGMGTGAMPPLHEQLTTLDLPVHLVVGANDHKFVAIAQSMATKLPDARLSVIDGAGHAAHLEQPNAVAAIVSGWLPCG